MMIGLGVDPPPPPPPPPPPAPLPIIVQPLIQALPHGHFLERSWDRQLSCQPWEYAQVGGCKTNWLLVAALGGIAFLMVRK